MFDAGFLPPPSPGDSAQEVAEFYRDDIDLIRLGLFTMMIAGGIIAPFVAVIAVRLKRIEGQFSPMTINIPPAIVQCLSIGLAVLGHRRENPMFPRWVAYYNFWIAFLFVPGGLAMFFKDGAFAWNGLLAFWLAAVMFGTWFIVMSIVLRGAIRRSATEDTGLARP